MQYVDNKQIHRPFVTKLNLVEGGLYKRTTAVGTDYRTPYTCMHLHTSYHVTHPNNCNDPRIRTR